MMRRGHLCLLLALGVTACSPDRPVEQPPSDPVVVYVAYEDTTAIRGLLDRFSEETGVVIIDRRGPAEGIVDDLIENRISPPADVLLTRSVVHAWRAAEEGALRPLYSDVADAHLPGWARDEDKLWFAISAERAVIAFRGEPVPSSDLADLAGGDYAGRLCLSSSKNPINRAVIALLIEAQGIRPAELVVRGWIGNLASGPFGSDADVAEAMRSGTCAVGIMSASAAERERLSFLVPTPLNVDIAAAGVARHARNPDGAARLVEWLISRFDGSGLSGHAAQPVSFVAWYYEEAVKLAERARYD